MADFTKKFTRLYAVLRIRNISVQIRSFIRTYLDKTHLAEDVPKRASRLRDLTGLPRDLIGLVPMLRFFSGLQKAKSYHL
jgi:hypothetical protein